MAVMMMIKNVREDIILRMEMPAWREHMELQGKVRILVQKADCYFSEINLEDSIDAVYDAMRETI